MFVDLGPEGEGIPWIWAIREDEAVLEALQDLGLTLQDELMASLESEVPLMWDEQSWEDKQKVPVVPMAGKMAKMMQAKWEHGVFFACYRDGVIWIMNDCERFVVCPLLLNVRDDDSECVVQANEFIGNPLRRRLWGLVNTRTSWSAFTECVRGWDKSLKSSWVGKVAFKRGSTY